MRKLCPFETNRVSSARGAPFKAANGSASCEAMCSSKKLLQRFLAVGHASNVAHGESRPVRGDEAMLLHRHDEFFHRPRTNGRRRRPHCHRGCRLRGGRFGIRIVFFSATNRGDHSGRGDHCNEGYGINQVMHYSTSSESESNFASMRP
jgi:hypothetical protein